MFWLAVPNVLVKVSQIFCETNLFISLVGVCLEWVGCVQMLYVFLRVVRVFVASF